MTKNAELKPSIGETSRWVDIETIKLNPANSRTHSEEQLTLLRASLEAYGWTMPALIDENGQLIAGEGRVLAARGAGWKQARVIDAIGWTDAMKRAYTLADNQIAARADWDKDLLRTELTELKALNIDLESLGFKPLDIFALLSPAPQGSSTLVGRYGEVPFSVLDARQGRWQDRKRQWLALGIQSELGRGENLLRFSEQTQLRRSGAKAIPGGGTGPKSQWDRNKDDDSSGTSIFDPVLCEIAYLWFTAPGMQILDPFAGGSVRGIVASKLGRAYSGIDLSERQLAANREQAARICEAPLPQWIAGNSATAEMPECDFVFSCPPYGDLERYSDDEADLSTMDFDSFIASYRAIIQRACAALREDRFACFVVGDYRAPAGPYRGFVSETIRAFQDAGLQLWNDAVLVTACGSLPVRIRKQFENGRKLGKTHQNVLVFCKGDGEAAAKACGAVEYAALMAGAEQENDAEVAAAAAEGETIH